MKKDGGVVVLGATVISAALITHRPGVLAIIIDFWSLMSEAAGSEGGAGRAAAKP